MKASCLFFAAAAFLTANKSASSHPMIESWVSSNSPVAVITLKSVLGTNENITESPATIYLGTIEACAGCDFPENTIVIYATPGVIDIAQSPRLIIAGDLHKMLKPVHGNESVRFFAEDVGGYTITESDLRNHQGALSPHLQEIKDYILSQNITGS